MRAFETQLALVELVPSDGGRFEVSVDGRLIYSKLALGRHAQAGEVLGLVRKALGEGS